MRNLVIFISFICFCANSYAQDKIHWLSYDANASIEFALENSSTISMVTDTTRLLMTSLPKYQFSIEYAKSPSIDRLLKKLPNACAPNRVKNPKRLKESIFSLPLNIAPNLRLHYLKDKKSSLLPQNSLNKAGKLASLAALFTGKSVYTLGIDSGRSLGIFLDQQIASLDGHNLVVRTGGGSTTSLVQMLLKNRIDYILDYPFSVNSALNYLSSPRVLESLEIAGSPGYIIGYVACNNGEKGQQIIKEINIALQDLYNSYAFYQAHIRYLDKRDIANFNRVYQEIFQVDIPKNPVNSSTD